MTKVNVGPSGLPYLRIMRSQPRRAPRRALAWIVALALALSGLLPGHGRALAAGGPGADVIVICSADGARLIDRETGAPVEPGSDGRQAQADACTLCCLLAKAGLRPPRLAVALGTETPKVLPQLPARERAPHAAQHPWSPAAPRAPPPLPV